MEIVHSVAQFPCVQGSCVTIGTFDGVHQGHKALLERARIRARQQGLLFVVVTFWPHPRRILARDNAPPMLTSREHRQVLLESSGVDILLELPFSMELAALTPQAFIETVLFPAHMKHLVIGHDFSLGRGRSGDFTVLTALGGQLGFTVERLHSVIFDGDIVSSTRIRHLIGNGNIARANRLLGYTFSLEGEVIHGCGRGRGLGFPTANIAISDVLTPRQGVYATRVRCGESLWQAVTNVGTNPTVGGTGLSIESFLLAEEGRQASQAGAVAGEQEHCSVDVNLYGKFIRLFFVKRLRDEQKFPSLEMLQARIAVDVAEARQLFAEYPLV